MTKTYGRVIFLLFLYFLLSFGYIFSRGFYSSIGSLIILISIILTVLKILKPDFFYPGTRPAKLGGSVRGWDFKIKKKLLISVFSVSLFLNISLTALLYGGLYQYFKPAVLMSNILLKIMLVLSLALLFNLEKKYLRPVLKLLFIIWLVLHLLMIVSSPRPLIDVFDYLKQGALAFWQGKNPYSISYQKMYLDVMPNYYSYFPFMIFYTLPFVLIFNDPRFSFVFSQITIFYFLAYKFSWKDKCFGQLFSVLIALLILFHPLSLYMTEQSYTEPLVFLEILLLYYFLTKKNKFSAFVYGISLATKQYLFFLAPFLYKNKLFKKKHFFYAFLVFFLLISPFFLASPKDFVYDTILLQNIFPPRYEGLTFFSSLFRLFKLRYPFVIALTIWLGFGIFLIRRNAKQQTNFILEYALFLLVFFYFNKWAFLNYYYLISNLYLLSIFITVHQTLLSPPRCEGHHTPPSPRLRRACPRCEVGVK